MATVPRHRPEPTAQKAELDPVCTRVADAGRALDEFELRAAVRLQTRVVMGDAVLDAGVRSGAARTRLALKGKSGLGVEHVFSGRVDTLTDASLRLEPRLVTEAAARLDDLAAFEGRDAITTDLVVRAN